jgi:hypothetical protein
MNTTQHSETAQNDPMCATDSIAKQNQGTLSMLNFYPLGTCKRFSVTSRLSLKIRRVAIKIQTILAVQFAANTEPALPGRIDAATNSITLESLRPEQPLLRIRGSAKAGRPSVRTTATISTSSTKLGESPRGRSGGEGGLTGGRRGRRWRRRGTLIGESSRVLGRVWARAAAAAARCL